MQTLPNMKQLDKKNELFSIAQDVARLHFSVTFRLF